MPLESFIAALFGGGVLRVPPPSAAPPTDPGDAELDRLLRGADAAARLEVAGRPPKFDPAVAAWAARTLLAASQAIVYRELDEEWLRTALGTQCPWTPSPSTCYSADLAMRRLPDLHALARGLAESDPLLDALAGLARAWPLSSVGLPVDQPETLDTRAFIGDASLRRLYADRILERDDASRLCDPRAADAVREAVGASPALAPRAVAAALEGNNNPAGAPRAPRGPTGDKRP